MAPPFLGDSLRYHKEQEQESTPEMVVRS
jgi:hypothetical protein